MQRKLCYGMLGFVRACVRARVNVYVCHTVYVSPSHPPSLPISLSPSLPPRLALSTLWTSINLSTSSQLLNRTAIDRSALHDAIHTTNFQAIWIPFISAAEIFQKVWHFFANRKLSAFRKVHLNHTSIRINDV